MAKAVSQVDMQEMKIRYGGGNEIKANTYINSLVHFTNIVQEVNKNLSKERSIEVKVRANKEGSFIVDLLIEASVLEGVKHMFTADNLKHAAEIVKTVSDVYKVAKHLLGHKPKNITNDKDSTITIENNSGTVQNFDFRGANIYLNSPTIREAIAQEFETLESDGNVTDFEFLDKEENKIFEANRKEFYSMSSSGSSLESNDNEKIQTILNASLNISSLDLEFKKKWDFYYLGNKISAKVKDDAFGERINNGERFGKGDTFVAELEITQIFDASVQAYINKSYTVTKIIQHIERPEQAKLDLK